MGSAVMTSEYEDLLRQKMEVLDELIKEQKKKQTPIRAVTPPPPVVDPLAEKVDRRKFNNPTVAIEAAKKAAADKRALVTQHLDGFAARHQDIVILDITKDFKGLISPETVAQHAKQWVEDHPRYHMQKIHQMNSDGVLRPMLTAIYTNPKQHP